ncbi:MAG: UDP-N-acetylmuramate--L-alanine ligase, partial [Muribaculaceae bacterium]|nr:UDP-N-acetylmuramate--L-alanine ligase [Muribaculaceae bacterium]
MELNNIYFIGIGGIGMAALARYFLSKGFNVAGYDRTLSALTEALVREGAAVSDIDSMDAVPEAFTDPDDTLVVYTPAVPKDNVQLRFFTDHGFNVMKRAAVLGWVT